MAISFPVAIGTVLLCDYQGFKVPEMVKRRPAVVVSPRLPHRDSLCTVIPLSQREPRPDIAYQCRIEFPEPLPDPYPFRVFYAKADMLATVGFWRFDLFRTNRDQTGKRRYLHPRVTTADLERIRNCILHALSMGDLTN